MMKSASSNKGITIPSRIFYSFKLFQIRLKNKQKRIIPWQDIEEYESYLAKYMPIGQQKLTNHSVLEIGFGARPWRLFSMMSLGVDIKGIDLDQPTYGFNPKRLWRVLKTNGFERFIKSLVRGIFFDLSDIRSLKRELKKIDKTLRVDESRIIIGDVGDERHFQENSFTFAFSEDVFEHIPAAALPKVLVNIRKWLKAGSILLLRPHVYTGISGGHDPEFYHHKVKNNEAPADKAWRHLLNPHFKVNTFLNQLRIDSYVNLFSEHFEVLEIINKDPDLGKNYLTQELKDMLIGTFTLEELLTNQVAFILRVRK